MKRLRVGVLFGGKSGEHEVSVMSGRSMIQSLDPCKYEAIPIGISKEGKFVLGEAAQTALQRGFVESLPSHTVHPGLGEEMGEAWSHLSPNVTPAHHVKYTTENHDTPKVDVIIPVLHGSYGEDGAMQGMLEMLGIPYVGSGVLASALCMDKIAMKQLFSAHGFPQVKYMSVLRSEWENDSQVVERRIEETLGYPCFVKPANLGSSVGISKVTERNRLHEAMQLAAQYDRRLIIEQGLQVREIEIAVLGNDNPQTSVPGEVIPAGEFYDYNAKYISGESKLLIPAPMSDTQKQEVQEIAIAAYRAADCAGLARVDFFIEKNTGKVYLNEINTMPGFTQYSMYPKLWEATGMGYAELVDRLIQLALERFEEQKRKLTDFALPGQSVSTSAEN